MLNKIIKSCINKAVMCWAKNNELVLVFNKIIPD